MALAVETSASTGIRSNVTSLAWAHTVTAGNLLCVALAANGGTPGCTWGATSCSQIDTIVDSGRQVWMWALYKPLAGASNVSCSAFSSGYAGAYSISYTGAQPSPIESTCSASGTGTSISMTKNSPVNSIVMDVINTGYGPTGYDATMGAGQTRRLDLGNGQFATPAGSTEPATSSQTTMSWTMTGSVSWVHLSAVIAAPSAGNQILMLYFERMKKLYDDIKAGILSPPNLRKRYKQLYGGTQI